MPKNSKVAPKNSQKKTVEVHRNKTQQNVRFVKIVSYLLFLLTAVYFTAFANANLLLKIHDQSLFLVTKQFLCDKMGLPAGLLFYLNAFFIQFFQFPAEGGCLFVAFLLWMQLVAVKVFKIPDRLFPLSFVPSVVLLLSVTNLDYIVYLLDTKGFAFSGVIGGVAVLTLFYLYRFIPRNGFYRVVTVPLSVACFYPLLGFYALLAAVLVVVVEWRNFIENKQHQALFIAAASLVAVIVFPLFFHYAVYQHTTFSHLYLYGLPDLKLSGGYLWYWLPYVLLCLSVVVFVSINLSETKPHPKINAVWVGLSCWALMYGALFFLSNRDENFHAELAIDKAISRNDWSQVLEINRQLTGEPTRKIVISTNLALQKMGLAGDQMFTYKNGAKPYNGKLDFNSLYFMELPVYYQYGLINECYRWCFEEMTTTGMTVEKLQYMVKCAILNKEYALANKYNMVLKHTLFYRDWANEYQQYIDDPGKVANNDEFKHVLSWLATHDKLVEESDLLENYLTVTFATYEQGTANLLELSLQFNMLAKNMQGFWPRFFFYLKTHRHIPVHYQEAALLFAHFDKRIDIANIRFDAQIVARFKEALSIQGNEEQVRKIFAERFGDTYWNFYFFLNFNVN